MQENIEEKEQPYIVVIGAANVDIVGFPNKPLLQQDSNLGKLRISMGGVGRNIAENLARLGVPVKLIAPIGDDVLGKEIMQHCQQVNIDISESLFLKNTNTSTYLAIMDHKKDLALGLAAMDICGKTTPAFIQLKKEIIKGAKLVVLETNIPEHTLLQAVKDNPQQIYFMDTSSADLSLRATNILPYLFALKTNQLEAETLTGIDVSNISGLKKAALFFHQKGVKHVFITLGKKGAFLSSASNVGRVPNPANVCHTDIITKNYLPKKIKVKNTNGAGDAFLAGVVFGCYINKEMDECAKMGMVLAEKTVQHIDAVHLEITERIF